MTSLGLVTLVVVSILAAAPTPARAATEAAPPGDEKPTPTIKSCHICDEEAAATPTPPTRSFCSECGADATPVATRATTSGGYLQPTPAAGEAIVHAAMFWMPGCPACEETLQHVLPALKAEYGLQLDLVLIEVATQEEVDQLFALAGELGIPSERTGVPFLIVGERVLVGPILIGSELPVLIEHYLDQGGVDLPEMPILTSALSRATPFDPGLSAADSLTDARPQGFTLAVIVLVVMMAVLLYALASLRSPHLPVPQGRWVDRIVPWLALIGLLAAAYLAYVETQSVEAFCGPVGECNAVQSSSYSRLFGVLPVGVLGALGYLLLLAAWAVERRGIGPAAVWAGLAGFGIALAGTIFSLYLTFLEPFIIRAVCLWCLTSSVTITLLLLLTLKVPRAWRVRHARLRR